MKTVYLVLAIIGYMALARDGRSDALPGSNRIAAKERPKVGQARHQGVGTKRKVQIETARPKPAARNLAVEGSVPGREASRQFHPFIPDKAKPALAKDSRSHGSTAASIGGPATSNKSTLALIGGTANTAKKNATINGTTIKGRH
jgi:hypothetical protein